MFFRRAVPFLLHLAHAVLCKRPGASGVVRGEMNTQKIVRSVASVASLLRKSGLGHAQNLADATPAGNEMASSRPLTLAAPYLVRPATADDIDMIQRCNRASLPENYNDFFFSRHLRLWSDLSFVAHSTTDSRVICGYILGKVDEAAEDAADPSKLEGHITSLAVSDAWRRRGVARRLMDSVHYAMAKRHLSRTRLHVRCSNASALQLYSSLGYTIVNVVDAYYQDGEAAFYMAAQLPAAHEFQDLST